MKPLLFIITSVLLFSCTTQKVNHPHQMYIWQRIWTPELVESIQDWQDDLSGIRVLTGLYSSNLEHKTVNINWPAVPINSNITQVYRINGTKLPPFIEASHLINNQLDEAHQNNRVINAIEIDFDSPTSKLAEYQEWLAKVKQELKHELELSITALPTWNSSSDLKKLLVEVDHYVLQIHSVESPDKGLVDFSRAEQWIKQFNKNYSKPFQVSLPNYWYQAATDKNNNIKAILAEGQSIESSASKQIFAEPEQLNQLKLKIEQSSLKNFQGWVWFRMPTNRDQQVFSTHTMQELMESKSSWKLKPVEFSLKPISESANSANYDLFIENPEPIEQITGSNLEILTNCEIQHLISGFEIGGSQLLVINPKLMKPNQSLRVGWVSCH